MLDKGSGAQHDNLQVAICLSSYRGKLWALSNLGPLKLEAPCKGFVCTTLQPALLMFHSRSYVVYRPIFFAIIVLKCQPKLLYSRLKMMVPQISSSFHLVSFAERHQIVVQYSHSHDILVPPSGLFFFQSFPIVPQNLFTFLIVHVSKQSWTPP